MSCEELRAALPTYLDRELGPAATLEAERHLASCAECSAIVANERAFRASFRDPSLRFGAPDALRARLNAALRARAGAARPGRAWSRTWLAAAALLVLGVAIGSLATRLALAPSAERVAEGEVLAAHLRSLAGDHLTEVASSDQHTVKPWFAGKLDFSPSVMDLSAEGFPLAGGRLDAIGLHPVAALVYRRRLHVINVFTWPARSDREIAPVATTMNGYHLIRWARSGMSYWAVSDLDAQELHRFAGLLASTR
ncbi:MAG: anti-sigma factor family protein [Thermoanaerobaculales bacterium]